MLSGTPKVSDRTGKVIFGEIDTAKKKVVDELLDKAGQHELPEETAEDLWEMERKLWAQRENKDAHLDDHSY